MLQSNARNRFVSSICMRRRLYILEFPAKSGDRRATRNQCVITYSKNPSPPPSEDHPNLVGIGRGPVVIPKMCIGSPIPELGRPRPSRKKIVEGVIHFFRHPPLWPTTTRCVFVPTPRIPVRLCNSTRRTRIWAQNSKFPPQKSKL